MELLLNIANLKSFVTFVHLSGLAIGVGGAWILDIFIMRHMNQVISYDKYEVISFISKLVFLGLFLLWLSGLAFIIYYYFYTPEYLGNQKVWAKLSIVLVLTFNGALVHKMIMPRLKKAVGRTLIETCDTKDLRLMSSIGGVSFISWLFPIVLGVTSTLNFTVSAAQIFGVYAASLILSVAAANIIASSFLHHKHPLQTDPA